MMYKKFVIFCMIFLLTGCSFKNSLEDEKNDYLNIKSKLEKNSQFADYDSLPCDITINSIRESNDNIKYYIEFNNSKENMNNIKILVVHNGIISGEFPSIGIMDNKIISLNKYENIILDGLIESDKNIVDLHMMFKIWMQYNDIDGNNHEVFYKTTI